MGWRFGECVFDVDRWELRRADQVVQLEPRAMSILRELIEQRGRVVTKEELLDRVWGDRFVSESALTTQIKAIRRAVGDDGRAQAVLRTVHGQGYMFVAQVIDEAVDGSIEQAVAGVGDPRSLGPVGLTRQHSPDGGGGRA